VIHPLPIGVITQRFGARPEYYAQYGLAGHEGLDLAAPAGTPVVAAHAGSAITYHGSPTYGEYVCVSATGLQTLYAHLSRIDVRDGDAVTPGQIIGAVGVTGNSTGPHLHFGVRPIPIDFGNGFKGWCDPEPYLTQEGNVLTTLHVQRREDWQNAWARDVGAGWIKIVNPPEGVLLFPDVPRVLGRIWTDNIDNEYIRRGREGGAAFVRDMLPQWTATPEVIAWELCNEPDCNSNVGLAALNNYTLGAIEEANRWGLRLCVLNLPEGNPSGDDAAIRWKWEQLLPCVKAAAQGGHYVGLHAYWRPGVEGPDGRWHALGRRNYDCEVLEALGARDMHVLINETGIDGGIAPDMPGQQPQHGWRDLTTPDAYREDIAQAEAYARNVGFFDALMLFTAGYEQPWGSYDVDETFARGLIGPLQFVGDLWTPEDDVEEDAPVTERLSADVAATALRWHIEEAVRELQAGKTDAAKARLLALVNRDTGLAYRCEWGVHAVLETLAKV